MLAFPTEASRDGKNFSLKRKQEPMRIHEFHLCILACSSDTMHPWTASRIHTELALWTACLSKQKLQLFPRSLDQIWRSGVCCSSSIQVPQLYSELFRWHISIFWSRQTCWPTPPWNYKLIIIEIDKLFWRRSGYLTVRFYLMFSWSSLSLHIARRPTERWSRATLYRNTCNAQSLSSKFYSFWRRWSTTLTVYDDAIEILVN